MSELNVVSLENPKTIYLPITELSFLEKNPRKINKAELEILKKSIKDNYDFFWARPLLVNNRTGKNVVYAGNQRLKAAMELGLREVPCIVESLSEEKQKERTIRDNVQSGDWDASLLAQDFDLKALTEWGIDPALLNKYSVKVNEDDFDVDTKLKSPKYKVEKGDLFILGNHRLLCGDATIKDDVITLMDGKMVDLLLTDPPYGVDYSSKNRFLNSISKGNHVQKPILGDAQSPEDMQKFWEKCLLNAQVNMKDGASYYVNSMQGGDLLLLLLSLKNTGFELKQSIVWVKNNHVLGRSDYNYKHELILYGWKGSGHKFYSQFDTTVWEFDKPSSSKLHPTMKPIELLSKPIVNSTKEGELVLDLFGGSGSTLIACEQTNRVCFMMEIEPHYISTILERWETLTGKKAFKKTGEELSEIPLYD